MARFSNLFRVLSLLVDGFSFLGFLAVTKLTGMFASAGDMADVPFLRLGVVNTSRRTCKPLLPVSAICS